MSFGLSGGQDALNNKESIEVCIKKEYNFFSNTVPWKNEDPQLFGTPNLRRKLAHIQRDLVRSSFPSIISEIKDKLERALVELERLGDVPTSFAQKRSMIRNIREVILRDLNAEVLGGARGESANATFIRIKPSAKFHKASARFRDKLSKTKFANVSDVVTGSRVVAIVNGEEVRDEVCYESSKYICIKRNAVEMQNVSPETAMSKAGKRFNAQFTEPTVTRTDSSFFHPTTKQDGTSLITFQHISAMDQYEMKSVEELRMDDHFAKSRRNADQAAKAFQLSKKKQNEHKCFYISESGKVCIERSNGTFDILIQIPRSCVRADPQWLCDRIQHNRPYALPIFIDTRVFESIIAEFIGNQWTEPSLDLLKFTSKTMESAAKSFILQLKGIRSVPRLASFLGDKSAQAIKQLQKDTERKLMEFVQREKVPYTQDHYLYENLSKLRFQRLMDEVMQAIEGTNSDGDAVAPSRDVSAAVRNVFERNQKKSVDEHMAEEMQHALNAYGKVAFKRFIDTVPMICIEIMQRFPEKLYEYLSDISDDDIERTVSAPPEVLSRMQKLKDEVAALRKNIDSIQSLM